jgi:hypothetical protein
MQQPTQQYMQPPAMQQQPYVPPVYYTNQQAFPDNRQSIMKPSPYDTVAEENKYGQYQNQNDGAQQSPMSSPNTIYSSPSPGPPVYMPQGVPPPAEMLAVTEPHHGIAELGQR